ncbi:MAG: hypothetical protein KF847_11955 [Pirellulales bacterium]|nr:hypothetical protein [Pirellulales bacterium]
MIRPSSFDNAASVRLAQGLVCLAVGLVPLSAPADVAFEPSWRPPRREAIVAELQAFLARGKFDAEQTEAAIAAWNRPVAAATGEEATLDRLVAALAVVDARVGELARQWSGPFAPGDATWLAWLADAETDEFERHNVRLAHGRWLAQQGLFDEAVRELGDLQIADVADPASLLFYRMASYHQLVRPDEARADLVLLLERESTLPRRFQQLAQLVRRDLATLKDDSLNHISRRMNDIERRLELGHAGPRVQEVERGVLDALDKLIKQAEDEAQCQQCSQSGGSNPGPSKPMDDSRIAELKGPGKVDPRDLGRTSGWGDLPPKEREQALQQIGREFPAQYREAIEQYFRELATESPRSEP